MKYIEAPGIIDWDNVEKPTVFLAGGITNCPDWQQEVVNHEKFKDIKGTFVNPRRAEFDINDKSLTEEQIKWEYDALQKTEIVSFWFAKETIQPIVLYELGYFLGKIAGCKCNHKQWLCVAAHKDYPRKMDIIHQIKNALGDCPVFDDEIEDHVNIIIKNIQSYKEYQI